MIARLSVAPPFVLSVPADAAFRIYEYEAAGYKVRFFPPARGPCMETQKHGGLTIDGVQACQCDIIRIDFIAERFKRTPEPLFDPPCEVIQSVLDSYVVRLRHVTGAPGIRPFQLGETSSEIIYLNDDETPLPQEQGSVRGRGRFVLCGSHNALTASMWDEVHSLPTDYVPPPWESLLLDATLSGVSSGNSIVLATTALEVFISHVLDGLATRRAQPNGLWEWINNRFDHEREPSLEEQYDVLLKVLTSHSLKEDRGLWQAFRDVKSARNSFVHEGIARIGKASEPVDPKTVRSLIHSAELVISKIREWLPDDMRWKQQDQKPEIRIWKRLLSPFH